MSPEQSRSSQQPQNIEPGLSYKEREYNVLSFGELVKMDRHILHLSQRELSLLVGINHAALSRIERGRSSPTISIASAISMELKQNDYQTFRLITSLAKPEDKGYVLDLFSRFSATVDSASSSPVVFIAEGTPIEKARAYKEKRNRTHSGVATIGGVHRATVRRFLLEEINEISGSTFVSIARGLTLNDVQFLDFFRSFGKARVEQSFLESFLDL